MLENWKNVEIKTSRKPRKVDKHTMDAIHKEGHARADAGEGPPRDMCFLYCFGTGAASEKALAVGYMSF